MVEALIATLHGDTRHFKGNGRKLGYPTANIDSATALRDGVYFGFADLGEYKRHPATIFIGTPITVGDMDRRVEAHLLDIADANYYGQGLTLEISHFQRPNRKFDNIDDLLTAMKKDETDARAWFKKRE